MTKKITDLEGRLDAAFRRSEAAKLLGSAGGKKRAAKLTPQRRLEISKLANAAKTQTSPRRG